MVLNPIFVVGILMSVIVPEMKVLPVSAAIRHQLPVVVDY